MHARCYTKYPAFPTQAHLLGVGEGKDKVDKRFGGPAAVLEAQAVGAHLGNLVTAELVVDPPHFPDHQLASHLLQRPRPEALGRRRSVTK